MKKTIVLVSVVLGMMSCSKNDDNFATPSSQLRTIAPTVKDSTKRSLSVSIPSFGIDYDHITPSKVYKLYNDNIVCGRVYQFYKNNCAFTVVYDWNVGVIHIGGTIDNHSFHFNMSQGTINICGGQQNVYAVFNFYDQNYNIIYTSLPLY